MKLLKLLGILLVIASIVFFFVARHIFKGIGDSLEDSIISVYEFSESIDSLDRVKFDSIKNDILIKLDTVMPAKHKVLDTIFCTNSLCEGVYTGPEFVENSDVAHQFSNKMAGKVGNKLKELYDKGIYSKVDFAKIRMSTVGMGSGFVEYKIKIPFEKVQEKCNAFTSFDHVGGWNHKPALSRRKKELKDVLLDGQELVLSELKTTPEGLQEYWIQWKNKVKQADCK